MTRRFRTTLFIALAAAVGLHLRPCLGCLVAEESCQEGPGRRRGGRGAPRDLGDGLTRRRPCTGR